MVIVFAHVFASLRFASSSLIKNRRAEQQQEDQIIRPAARGLKHQTIVDMEPERLQERGAATWPRA